MSQSNNVHGPKRLWLSEHRHPGSFTTFCTPVLIAGYCKPNCVLMSPIRENDT